MDRKPKGRKHAPAWEDMMSQAEFMKKCNLVMEGDDDGDDDEDDNIETVLEPKMMNADELQLEVEHFRRYFLFRTEPDKIDLCFVAPDPLNPIVDDTLETFTKTMRAFGFDHRKVKLLIGLGPPNLTLKGFVDLFDSFGRRDYNLFDPKTRKHDFHGDIETEDLRDFHGICAYMLCNNLNEFKDGSNQKVVKGYNEQKAKKPLPSDSLINWAHQVSVGLKKPKEDYFLSHRFPVFSLFLLNQVFGIHDVVHRRNSTVQGGRTPNQ